MAHTPRAAHLPLRQAQLVVAALAAGVVMATVVMVVLRGSLQSQSQAGQLIPIIVLALVGAHVGAYVFLRGRTRAQLADMHDAALELLREGRLPQPIFTLSVIAGGLAEGTGLLGAVGVLLGGPWYLLAAPALAVLVIALQVPTRARAEEMVRASRR